MLREEDLVLHLPLRSLSRSRQTNCRRGRYWISALATMPSVCAVSPTFTCASGVIRV